MDIDELLFLTDSDTVKYTKELTPEETLKAIFYAKKYKKRHLHLVFNVDDGKEDEIIKFGSYQGEQLEFKVLQTINNYSLMVCTKIVKIMQYGDELGTRWENSKVRTWLNGEFFEKAFSDEEKTKIVTRVTAPKFEIGYKPKNMLEDKVFLMGKADTLNLITTASERIRPYMDYIYDTLMIRDANGSWLIDDFSAPKRAPAIGSAGYIVDRKSTDYLGVVPVIIIKRDK